MSNSSIDSGSGSGGAWAGAGVGLPAAGGVGATEVSGGDEIGWLRDGTALGSSVEVAISSRRDVAASSLDGLSAGDAARRKTLPAMGGTAPLDECRQVMHVVLGSHVFRSTRRRS